ncbi:hypothetical protein Purlil1_8660 [Purpureocillium lilacinum]|uniref:Uncharacterized protein n=1 Tax=Purpureocillium lilacinum TaxID=33203 RepID=A0ABR0BSU4_PURLI|nr:hypothetical protein Purlil1_8660 [Purpureocillium lilacinum]
MALSVSMHHGTRQVLGPPDRHETLCNSGHTSTAEPPPPLVPSPHPLQGLDAHGMEWHGKLGSHTARASPFWGALHYLPTASCPVLLLGLGCCRWDAWSSRAEARPRVPGVDPQPLHALPLLHHHAWKNTTSSLTSPPRPLFVNRLRSTVEMNVPYPVDSSPSTIIAAPALPCPAKLATSASPRAESIALQTPSSNAMQQHAAGAHARTRLAVVHDPSSDLLLPASPPSPLPPPHPPLIDLCLRLRPSTATSIDAQTGAHLPDHPDRPGHHHPHPLARVIRTAWAVPLISSGPVVDAPLPIYSAPSRELLAAPVPRSATAAHPNPNPDPNPGSSRPIQFPFPGPRSHLGRRTWSHTPLANRPWGPSTASHPPAPVFRTDPRTLHHASIQLLLRLLNRLLPSSVPRGACILASVAQLASCVVSASPARPSSAAPCLPRIEVLLVCRCVSHWPPTTTDPPGRLLVPLFLSSTRRIRRLPLSPFPPASTTPSPARFPSTPSLRPVPPTYAPCTTDRRIESPTMPSRLSNGASHTKFELPALNLDFGSITDGTNIPPPPASPVQEVPTPPQTPPADKKEPAAVAKAKPEAAVPNGTPNGTDKPVTSTPPNGNLAGTKRPADEPPLSPAGSGRQGSLRRLFSRNMLNASYTEGRSPLTANGSVTNLARPESRGASSVVDDRKSKRSSGWFRRLRGGDPKRSSLIFEDAASTISVPSPKKPSAPPPPMIPELADLEKDDGGLGYDMFKNIK